MHLTAVQMRELEEQAKLFTGKHVSPLSQLLKSLSNQVDPVDVLLLLSKLWDTSFASRSEQKEALNQVGSWLEQQLNSNPGVASAELSVKVGWLKRLARINEPHQQQTGKGQANQTLRLTFGNQIERLRARRQQARQAGHGAGTPPQAPTKAIEAQAQTWIVEAITWNPGSQELAVTSQGKAAKTRLQAALNILATLDPVVADKIKKNKKPSCVLNATTKPLGTAFELVSLAPT